MKFFGYYESPLGLIEIGGTAEAITSLDFVEQRREGSSNSLVEEAVAQTAAYFARERQQFELSLVFQGTEFQCLVWRQLMTIPYGTTVSYGEVARAIGKPRAVRAVGAANGRNSIALFVPCHRVIGSDGSLTGYAGGLWRKTWLLKHEGCL